jgi:hypothetical protein
VIAADPTKIGKKFLCAVCAGFAVRVALALSDSRLHPIDHKARHSVEECPKDLLGLCR